MAAYTGIVLFNYRLTRELGEGGFGVVYEAIHEQLGRRAAVKILHPAFARHDEVVARFFREAQAACAIGHRAIVDITNYGKLDTGEPFIMMDYVAGRALSGLTAEDGPLPLHRLVEVFGPVASALTAAHSKGVIHRDLKPDNIMVAIEDGAVADVKLLDFGIAKLTDAKSNDVSTRAGSVMGTPNYMAPEQATDAKSVDARADVYSFAATVYAALTGRPPFEADSTTALLIMVTTRPPPRLRTLRPDAPDALDALLATCMEKDPAMRPATIDAAWRAMRATVGGPVSAGPLAVVPAASSQAMPIVPAAPHQTTLSGASGEPTGLRTGGSRRLGILIAAVGLLAIVIGVVAWPRSGRDEARSAAGEPGVAGESADAAPAVVAVIDAAEAVVVDETPTVDAAPEVVVVAIDAGVDAAPASVRTEVRPDCARATLERAVAKASAAQRGELRRRVERCGADGGLARRDRDRLLATLATSGTTTGGGAGSASGAGASSGSAAAVTVTVPDEPLCTKASFAAVYTSRSTSKDAAERALRRLGKCEAEQKISAADAKTARSALTAIVLSQ